MAVEKKITPHRIEIVFDHETGAFQGAFFTGIEQMYVDGQAIGPPSQTQAIPLNTVIEDEEGKFVEMDKREMIKALEQFDTRLSADHKALQEKAAKLETDLAEMTNAKIAAESQRDAATENKARIIKALEDTEAARRILEQKLLDKEAAPVV